MLRSRPLGAFAHAIEHAREASAAPPRRPRTVDEQLAGDATPAQVRGEVEASARVSAPAPECDGVAPFAFAAGAQPPRRASSVPIGARPGRRVQRGMRRSSRAPLSAPVVTRTSAVAPKTGAEDS